MLLQRLSRLKSEDKVPRCTVNACSVQLHKRQGGCRVLQGKCRKAFGRRVELPTIRHNPSTPNKISAPDQNLLSTWGTAARQDIKGKEKGATPYHTIRYTLWYTLPYHKATPYHKGAKPGENPCPSWSRAQGLRQWQLGGGSRRGSRPALPGSAHARAAGDLISSS